ncbi:unnamed protein product [Zymoseptoria tritici ST99CH_1A5]|uniref:BTB domain-containing protein n=1 Tax=Zymoseptoria tritici ST99CH_1A5 TaxID=1276529 RepID=A0A1Y6LQI7_ZYMTR|nr:unnamed protein product [Zymoseptoria tritici ST99CH_1A5]
MALDHPFDAPAKHQLQQVLDFVALKTDINDQELNTQSSATGSWLEDELNINALDSSSQNHETTLSPTSPIIFAHDHATIEAMAPKRKSEFEEFEKTTKPFLGDELVTVTLDGSSSSHKVSKAMLCHASPYFVKALSGSFKQARERTLRLPGCDEDTFKLFIGYLANNRLPDYTAAYEASMSPGDETATDKLHTSFQDQLINLWSLADAYLMPSLQNKAMRQFLQLTAGGTILAGTASLAYEKTADGSVMRQAVVGECVNDYATKTLAHCFNEVWFKRMGTVQSFFYDFSKTLAACSTNNCDHDDSHSPSLMVDQSRYMVPES